MAESKECIGWRNRRSASDTSPHASDEMAESKVALQPRAVQPRAV